MKEVAFPFFLCLFIYCYLLWFFCWNSLWDQIQGWDTYYKSYKTPHCAKDFDSPCNLTPFFKTGCVSSFGDSSSNAFFAHLTPSGTAIIQAHSILRGTERREQSKEVVRGFKTFNATGIQNDFAVWHFQHAFSVVNLTRIVLYDILTWQFL